MKSPPRCPRVLPPLSSRRACGRNLGPSRTCHKKRVRLRPRRRPEYRDPTCNPRVRCDFSRNTRGTTASPASSRAVRLRRSKLCNPLDRCDTASVATIGDPLLNTEDCDTKRHFHSGGLVSPKRSRQLGQRLSFCEQCNPVSYTANVEEPNLLKSGILGNFPAPAKTYRKPDFAGVRSGHPQQKDLTEPTFSNTQSDMPLVRCRFLT